MALAPGHHFLAPNVRLHVLEATRAGPTALIQAGIHGDEVAGVHALEEILEAEWAPTHGRLLICPVMNPPAYRARQRSAPGGLDLNRCFPGQADAPERERRLARTFMDLVESERPAMMVTLHESHKRYDPAITPSFGQTLVVGVDPVPAIVLRTVERLNQRYPTREERWEPQIYPVSTSSTEVIVDKIGCIGICVETWMGFDEVRRIEMQRSVVEFLLDDLGIRKI